MSADCGLSLRGVVAHRGSIQVLGGVDLAVPFGSITALLGPNGAGKSSLVLAMGGVIEASGSMELDGTSLLGRRPDIIRRAGVAVVPEGHRVLRGLTVADNLAVASGTSRRQHQGALAGVLDVLPELDPLLGRVAGSLSGGQQQMLAIGQALAARPRILVVDELSLGLAPLVVDRLLQVLVDQAAGGTGVLLIEQFADKALRVATHAAVLSGGAIVRAGAASELRRDADVLDAIYFGASELAVPTGVGHG